MPRIEQLIKKIIPYPADYSHREGFSNRSIIDNLTSEEKDLVETGLINLLNEHPSDTLIVETLAYMKSEKALPTLRNLLQRCKHGFDKLSISTSIYDIGKDNEMIDIAIEEFKLLESNDDIMAAFYYLAKFHNEKTNDLIGKYLDHKNYLISYNAKRFYVQKN
jgi:hypothetical protein